MATFATRARGRSLTASSPPSAFEIGRADFGTLQQIGAGPGERDQAIDHDIAAMGELERMVGVLLDDQDGQAVLAVEGADRIENLPRDERGKPKRRLVEQ